MTVSSDIEEIHSYRDRLRTYSDQELEDVYFNIHILRHPLRYRLIMMEMERRKLRPSHADQSSSRADIETWLRRRALLKERPALMQVTLWSLLLLSSLGATLAMLLPIWLFVGPLHFVGLQPAIVYFAVSPVPFILGAGIGMRLGGRGIRGVPVFVGMIIAAMLFNATGAPSTVIHSIIEHQGGGGFQIGGF